MVNMTTKIHWSCWNRGLDIGVDYAGDAGDASPPDFVKVHFVPTTIIMDYSTSFKNARFWLAGRGALIRHIARWLVGSTCCWLSTVAQYAACIVFYHIDFKHEVHCKNKPCLKKFLKCVGNLSEGQSIHNFASETQCNNYVIKLVIRSSLVWLL